jgi:hypothetical protein
VERGCSVGGLLGGGCHRGTAGLNRSHQQDIGTVFISQEIRHKISATKRTPDHISRVFRSFLSEKA